MIVGFGGWLRLSGSNWDDGRHLHPDERYVTEVAASIRWPDSLGQYLNVHDSPLSPYETEPGRNYVYGQLPLFGGKLFASALGEDDYDHLNIDGRRLSALIDMGSIVLVFLLGRMVFARFGRRAANAGSLLAAALYACTVTAFQAAHFFTTESWLLFFGLLTIVLMVRAVQSAAAETPDRFRLQHVLVGASLGLTVASKVSGLLVVLPVAIGLVGEGVIAIRRTGALDAVLRAGASALTVVVAAYVAFRAVSPYAFANSSWLELRILPAYRDALRTQRDVLFSGQSLYPPTYQWLLSPRIWDPLRNLVTWQLGLTLGIAAIAGLAAMAVRAFRVWLRGRRERQPLEPGLLAELTVVLMLVLFVLLVFFYFASAFGHSGRYLVPIAPFAAVAAAYAVLAIRRRRASLAVGGVILVGTFLYALAYHHIYTVPTTRVAASDWIVTHVPAGSTTVNEHWDDSLPVGADAQRYKGVTLPVFDADDDTKLRKLYDGVSSADYYFVSSPRAWRTIGRLPERFPIMTRYYKALFAGRLGFTQVAHFSVEPELFGVQLHDIGAEEAFWVYDHAPVRIYKRTQPLTWSAFRNRLCVPAPAPPGC